MHVCPDEQLAPQAPQLVVSTSSAWQPLLHIVKPGPQKPEHGLEHPHASHPPWQLVKPARHE